MIVVLNNKRTLNFLSTALMLASVRETSSGLNLTMSSSLAVIRIVGSSYLITIIIIMSYSLALEFSIDFYKKKIIDQ